MSRYHVLSPDCENCNEVHRRQLPSSSNGPPTSMHPFPYDSEALHFSLGQVRRPQKAEPSPLSASTLSVSSVANSVADCGWKMSIPQAGTGTGSWLDFANLPSIAFDCYQCDSGVVAPTAARSSMAYVNIDPYVPATPIISGRI